MHSYNRLETWTSQGEFSQFGVWALMGAKQGREFAQQNWQNLEAMSQINDFDWLDSVFKNANAKSSRDHLHLDLTLANQNLHL